MGSRLISVESWERVFQVEARGSSKALRPACHVGVRVNSPMQLEHVKQEINTKRWRQMAGDWGGGGAV